MSESGAPKPPSSPAVRVARWRVVLPNLVTCLGLSLGVTSVAMAILGATEVAAWLIVVCVLLDKLDGTVARAVRGATEFGVQLDSLSDLITFGVAPAMLLVATVSGQGDSLIAAAPESGILGVVVALACLYAAAAALRLARFNLFSCEIGKTFFFGIPTTLAGAILATGYLTLVKYGLADVYWVVVPAAYGVLALAMVSNVPLPKVGRRANRWLNLFQTTNIALAYLSGFVSLFLPSAYRVPEYLLGLCLLYIVVGVPWSLAQGIRCPRGNDAA